MSLNMQKSVYTVYTDEQIAQIAHNLNAIIREAEGEPRPDLWNELPDDAWQRQDSIRQVCLIRENPEYTPKDDHDKWKKVRKLQGWSHGLVRDEQNKKNPLLVDWEDLPFSYRASSTAGFQVIRALLGNGW